MGEFDVTANEFLVFEEGPSTSFTLQWATYRDASDQTSLSRIWGGIHPPADDIPGRLIGEKIGVDAFEFARAHFYKDNDNDGFYSYEDCDDNDASVNPGAPEVCNGIDDDCNDLIDDDIPYFTYYRDLDGDGFGDNAITELICYTVPSAGYVVDNTDCNDNDASVNPGAPEVCNGIDDDCNDLIDDDIPYFTYYRDLDGDGYGDNSTTELICYTVPSAGYVVDNTDCNDNDASVNPGAPEVCNGIDNDCNDLIDDDIPYFTYYRDVDGDGFGDNAITELICYTVPSVGYVVDNTDCDDTNANINPDSPEIADNKIDEDCSGLDLFLESKLFPNPTRDQLTLHYDVQTPVELQLHDMKGDLVWYKSVDFISNSYSIDVKDLAQGIYSLSITQDDKRIYTEKFSKI